MRPALKTGLLTVWRNRDTVQIGIDPRRAIALTGMREARGLLHLLDGSRDHTQFLDAAREAGITADVADRVIALLAAGGALHDLPVSAYRDLAEGTRARLAPELATAALAHGDSDGGARILARRQGARVRVHGTSRAGVGIASILCAAGVGQVVSTGCAGTPRGRASTARGHTAPSGGSAECDLVQDEDQAHEGAQGHDRDRCHDRDRARADDLVIMADTPGRDLAATLLRRRIPHLAASASEAIGVVGPLVVPGHSACLRCLDLARAERDPAWPIILAQLTGRTADPPACDAVLATAVAAQAAAQALTFIDRASLAPAVTNGTLELALPDWRWRRRSWQPHPRCGCGSRHSS